MKLTVIGCGYLGAVHAAAMSELGHEVLGVETNQDQLHALSRGDTPFYEPGFSSLLARGLATGRLRFTEAATRNELTDAEVHFLTVGTPQRPNGRGACLNDLWAVVETLAAHLPQRDAEHRPLVVGKSTVPVGTARAVANKLDGRAMVVWNPEFLREGHAVGDTLHPDRIVYGLPDDPVERTHACDRLDRVYAPLLAEGIARLTMNLETAELVKTAANSFLATKISFINALASMCSATSADVTVLADALGRDERIGPQFLRAGIGFGGGCLPKDLRGLEHSADELGLGHVAALLRQVDVINRGQRDWVEQLAHEVLDGAPEGKKITILGVTFKPNSDDLRDSPALDTARRLARSGAEVTVCDPKGLDRLAERYPDLRTEKDPVRAMDGADLVILATEWEELTRTDPVQARARVTQPIMIDARNALVPEEWTGAGWEYYAIGR